MKNIFRYLRNKRIKNKTLIDIIIGMLILFATISIIYYNNFKEADEKLTGEPIIKEARISEIMDFIKDKPKIGIGNITIIQFFDFSEPNSAKWHNDTFNRLIQEYIYTGKASVYFIDYPLFKNNKNAEIAHSYAYCGRFMKDPSVPVFTEKYFYDDYNYIEAYDFIFKSQKQWAMMDYKDTEEFLNNGLWGIYGQKYPKDECLNLFYGSNDTRLDGNIPEAYRGIFDKNIKKSKELGVDAVPYFIILKDGKGVTIRGYYEWEVFKNVLESNLKW